MFKVFLYFSSLQNQIYPSIAIRKYEELKKPQTVGEWLMGLGLPEYTALFLRCVCVLSNIELSTLKQNNPDACTRPEYMATYLKDNNNTWALHEQSKCVIYEYVYAVLKECSNHIACFDYETMWFWQSSHCTASWPAQVI